MTISPNATWTAAIKNHPDFLKSTESIGSFASIINDPAFDATTCLRNLGNEPDPVLIFPSPIDHRPLIIHNIEDLGSTRINPDPIPFAIAGFGSSPVAVTFNPHALFRKTTNPIAVPKNLENLLKLDSLKSLSDMKKPPAPASTQPPTATTTGTDTPDRDGQEPIQDPPLTLGRQTSCPARHAYSHQ